MMTLRAHDRASVIGRKLPYSALGIFSINFNFRPTLNPSLTFFKVTKFCKIEFLCQEEFDNIMAARSLEEAYLASDDDMDGYFHSEDEDENVLDIPEDVRCIPINSVDRYSSEGVGDIARYRVQPHSFGRRLDRLAEENSQSRIVRWRVFAEAPTLPSYKPE